MNNSVKWRGKAHIEIQQSNLLEIPLNFLEMNNQSDRSLRFITKIMKLLTNNTTDEMNLKWSNIYGDLFAISIHRGKEQWYLSVWNATGGKSIASIEQKILDPHTDVIDNANYKILEQKTRAFSEGMIDCGNCGKQISITDIAGTYFAGSYCTHCWETKYKAIEARETYN